MKQGTVSFLFGALLSSLAFNAAFYVGGYAGGGILLFMLPLISLIQPRGFFATLTLGSFLGVTLYSPYFSWLLMLLLTKSDATLALAGVLYLFIVAYASLTFALFFFGISWVHYIARPGRVASGGTLVMASLLYLELMARKGFWFFGDVIEGFPLLSPLVPLAALRPFLYLVALVGQGPPSNSTIASYGYEVVHLTPQACERSCDKAILAQKLYHKITCTKRRRRALILSPESSFPYDLESDFATRQFLTQGLHWGDVLIIGTKSYVNLKEGASAKQVGLCLQLGRIMQTYDKQHTMPFNESINKKWKDASWAKSLFNANRLPFITGSRNNTFKIGNGLTVQPRMCSDIFLFKKSSDFSPIIWLTNDSWFIAPYRQWMQNYAALLAAYLGREILYVGHYDCTSYTSPMTPSR